MEKPFAESAMIEQKTIKRDPHKIFYGSSYDRGLQHLLEMWPDIKEAVPDATFECAYGWQLFDRFYGNNPSSMMWQKKMKEMMKADGIHDNDRLPQEKVHELMSTCGLWAYPAHFGEINCINALKSQALGAIPVVIDYAALETSVQFGIKVKGDIYDQEVKETFKKQLIWALNNPKWQEEVRKPMIKWALAKFPWSNIAKHWDSMFQGKDEPFWDKTDGKTIIIDGYTGNEVKNGKE